MTWHLIIGHGKTGSTYLQHTLSRSRSRLRDAGIAYPKAKYEKHGGNGAGLFHAPLPPPSAPNVLYCNEHMWRRMLTREILEYELAQMGRPRLLLFVRDPVEHALSVWQQNVKMGRLTVDSLPDYFRQYSIPRRVRWFIQLLENCDVDLKILNYSAIDLMSSVNEWLGVELDPFPGRVNRSLSISELRLGELHGRKYLRKFVRQMPHFKPAIGGPPLDVQEAMIERLSPDLDFIDEHITGERYRRSTLPPHPEDNSDITPEHMKIVRKRWWSRR
ncbi:hypothetical protein [Novosphingobium malaysiense]|uniref:Sulfotransferase domain-containing protein n=1 Tax=Novosphingobium malaysiense TaxID=1348853 RepID=A0A0B1ZPU3_9SPHN|nr:hypothetical protein [Novosphingobium malaysiense]KHK91217.1 hypothetical protein LK12_09950 [Novosphingobium malaysiense]